MLTGPSAVRVAAGVTRQWRRNGAGVWRYFLRHGETAQGRGGVSPETTSSLRDYGVIKG